LWEAGVEVRSHWPGEDADSHPIGVVDINEGLVGPDGHAVFGDRGRGRLGDLLAFDELGPPSEDLSQEPVAQFTALRWVVGELGDPGSQLGAEVLGEAVEAVLEDAAQDAGGEERAVVFDQGEPVGDLGPGCG
jgi:hypothetical protein